MVEDFDKQIRNRGYFSTTLAFAGLILAVAGYHKGMTHLASLENERISAEKPILAYHSNINGDDIVDIVIRNQDGSYRGLIGKEDGTYIIEENPLGNEIYMTHVPGLIDPPKFKKRKEDSWIGRKNLEGIFGDSPFE